MVFWKKSSGIGPTVAPIPEDGCETAGGPANASVPNGSFGADTGVGPMLVAGVVAGCIVRPRSCVPPDNDLVLPIGGARLNCLVASLILLTSTVADEAGLSRILIWNFLVFDSPSSSSLLSPPLYIDFLNSSSALACSSAALEPKGCFMRVSKPIKEAPFESDTTAPLPDVESAKAGGITFGLLSTPADAIALTRLSSLTSTT
uniref:Uncharacterized protein n=1 Tax=Opuntia streptacantha TaxID=393608 RepID=A0A7C9EP36_OPUST